MSPQPAEDIALAHYARDVLRAAPGGPPAVRPESTALRRRAAAFVTLRWPDGIARRVASGRSSRAGRSSRLWVFM